MRVAFVYVWSFPDFLVCRQRDFRSVQHFLWGVCGCYQERVLGLADELYCAVPGPVAFAARVALEPPSGPLRSYLVSRLDVALQRTLFIGCVLYTSKYSGMSNFSLRNAIYE